MKPVIKVENLSKQYRLGTVGTGTFAHDANRWWHTIRGKDDPYQNIGEANDRASKGSSDYVWALKDVNFEVMQGEVLGIIGKNGAGKSTLLKLLSRVTAPTTGLIQARGRIASLLEVGTGFHPELTGRENVFLNGAIMGMTKTEIRSKLEEIVDFSGCERYIDTPVKRYSSGMHVRLAFAVAAHLEPEILIVDEVLAVGDAEFQKKAIGKMQDVSSKDGRTVLFVSHNMASVRSLCNRGVLLENGTVKSQNDDIEAIITEYLIEDNFVTKAKLGEVQNRKGNGKLRFMDFSIKDIDDNIIIFNGKTIEVSILIKNNTDVAFNNVSVYFTITNDRDETITNLSNEYTGEIIPIAANETKELKLTIRNLPLVSGKYFITFYSEIYKEIADWLPKVAELEVHDGDFFSTGKTPKSHSKILIPHNFA